MFPARLGALTTIAVRTSNFSYLQWPTPLVGFESAENLHLSKSSPLVSTMPNDSQHIDPVVIGPLGQHTSSIIFLHGMGESTDSLKSVIVGWQAKAWMEGVKFILPQAKTIPIALVRLTNSIGHQKWPSYQKLIYLGQWKIHAGLV